MVKSIIWNLTNRLDDVETEYCELSVATKMVILNYKNVYQVELQAAT